MWMFERKQRNQTWRWMVCAFGLLSATLHTSAQTPDLSEVEILIKPVRGGVYMLEATGDVAGNIAVSVGNDGILIVDDQFSELADKIEAALQDVSSGNLRYILNTHHHADHSGGNAELVARSGALVIAHENTRSRLLLKAPGHWPVLTFSSELSIHFNGETVRVMALPGGHTDNDSIVFFEKANVVHMGDLFNSGRTSFPLADLSAGGNAVRIRDNIEQVLPLIPDNAVVIAGHGPLSDLAGLRDLHAMLEQTIEIVRSGKEQGISLDAMQKQGLPAHFDEWNNGYTRARDWIEMIYRSIP